MDLAGVVLYNGERHYRILYWDCDYLIPWKHDRIPTIDEVHAAVTQFYNNNFLGVVKCN